LLTSYHIILTSLLTSYHIILTSLLTSYHIILTSLQTSYHIILIDKDPVQQRRSVPRQPSFKSKYNTHSSLNKSVRFSASSKEKDKGFEGMCQLDRLHI
jgi:hypothetical protein